MKRYLIILGLFLTVGTYAQTTYYVDNLSGNDANSGTSRQSPFKTLERVNSIKMHPGDSLLFRRGSVWNGNLVINGNGSPNRKVVVGVYGSGLSPVLDAGGMIRDGEQASFTIRLFNSEYIELRDLKIRNYNREEIPGNVSARSKSSQVYAPKTGIYIEAKDCGTLHEIRLINLEICDINGDMSTKNNGGVFIDITRNAEPSKQIKTNFEGLYTEGCFIHDVDRTGWSNWSVWCDRSLNSQTGDTLSDGKIHNWYPSKKVVFRNNRFEKTGANGLIVRVADAPLIEYNLFTGNGTKGSGNASFPFNCDNALFQFNEACYTVYNTEKDSWDHKRDADAGGFDSDFRCKNTVIQYNYSHHNDFGGVLICCDGGSKTGFNDGSVIRYNVFESNGHHEIRTSGSVTNSRIYNNVIFSGSELDSIKLIWHKSWGGYSDSTIYQNNIFYSEGRRSSIDLGKSKRNSFEANIFFGNISGEPYDPLKITNNPLFVNGQVSPDRLGGFIRFALKKGSPAINSGVVVNGHSKNDMLGNPIKGKPDRGAFEYNK